jgi:hypothetical protein
MKLRGTGTILSFFLFSAGALFPCRAGAEQDGPAPRCDVVENADGVRLFYLPPLRNQDYFRFPRVFVPVPPNDHRLSTISGYVLYVGREEFRSFVGSLEKLDLQWRETHKHEELDAAVESLPLQTAVNNMEILVSFPHCLRKALLPPSRICQTLDSLSSNFHNKQAVYQYRVYRETLGCKVSGVFLDNLIRSMREINL